MMIVLLVVQIFKLIVENGLGYFVSRNVLPRFKFPEFQNLKQNKTIQKEIKNVC